MMAHDFIKFPELANSQMDFYYFESPHKQIFESFRATVTKVIDGDTIRVRWEERNFDFPVRFANIEAPELKELEGEESRSWLEEKILGEEVEIIIDPKRRVEKWGRLLGYIHFIGMDVGEESIFWGHAKAWNQRNEGSIPEINKELEIDKWF